MSWSCITVTRYSPLLLGPLTLAIRSVSFGFCPSVCVTVLFAVMLSSNGCPILDQLASSGLVAALAPPMAANPAAAPTPRKKSLRSISSKLTGNSSSILTGTVVCVPLDLMLKSASMLFNRRCTPVAPPPGFTLIVALPSPVKSTIRPIMPLVAQPAVSLGSIVTQSPTWNLCFFLAVFLRP